MPFANRGHVGFWFMSQPWLRWEPLGVCTWINDPVFNLNVTRPPAGRRNWGKGWGRWVPGCTVVGFLGHLTKGVLGPWSHLRGNYPSTRHITEGDKLTKEKHHSKAWGRVACRRWGKQTKHPCFRSHFFFRSCSNFLFKKKNCDLKGSNRLGK